MSSHCFFFSLSTSTSLSLSSLFLLRLLLLPPPSMSSCSALCFVNHTHIPCVRPPRSDTVAWNMTGVSGTVITNPGTASEWFYGLPDTIAVEGAKIVGMHEIVEAVSNADVHVAF